MARPKKTENAVARRDELINASAKLFNKLGFQRTTVRNIAEEIGITSGSIFYHFDNKEQLLEAVIEHGMTSGLSIVETQLSELTGPLSRFHGLVLSHLLALNGPPGDAHNVSFREWGSLSQKARNRLRAVNEQYRNVWIGELTNLKKHQRLKSDPEFCRRALIAALNWSPVWHKQTSKQHLEKASDQFCAVALNMNVADFVDQRMKE
jgi:TetR/AcrR family transcriptional regulator, cholesterol catabolism regulator